MWIEDCLALPSGPSLEDGRSVTKDGRRTCRILGSTQAAQPESCSIPVCLCWHTGGFPCRLCMCSFIHPTDTEPHVPGDVLNAHSITVLSSHSGVRRLPPVLQGPPQDVCCARYAAIWRHFRGLSGRGRAGPFEPLLYCAEELKSPGTIFPKPP